MLHQDPKHLDILLVIESAIVNVYRMNRDLRDTQAIKGLESLVQYYRSQATQHSFEEPSFDDPLVAEIYRDVIVGLNKKKEERTSEQPTRKRFSRASKVQSQEEIFLSCVRKIEKSARRWNKRNGPQGYLAFVNNHV